MFFQILVDLFIFMKFCGCHKSTPKVVIKEFNNRFSTFYLMVTMGLVYFKYWFPNECEKNFMKHIKFIKAHYNESQTHNHEIN